MGIYSFLQQQLTESAVAFEKTSVTAQFVTLQDKFEMVKKGILHAIREREEASHRAQQALEDQLKAKFEVKRDDGGSCIATMQSYPYFSSVN